MKLEFEEMNCCASCRFYKPYEEAAEGCDTDGDCRRYPPQVYGDSSVCRVSYPGVVREEWCGEWEAR